MTNAFALLAAAAAVFVHGSGPVQNLGKPLADSNTIRGGLVSDGERYFAFPLAPGGKVRVYDTLRRRSVTIRATCTEPAQVNRHGRFLLSCGETAEIVTAATHRVRRLTPQRGPAGVEWLGVGSRYAIYFRKTGCDSAGCAGDRHVVDLRTGKDQVRSPSDPFCEQTDYDVPRADDDPCPPAAGAPRYTLHADPGSGELDLLDRGRLSRKLGRSTGPGSGSEEIAQGWVTWLEVADDGAAVLHAESVSGKRKHTWHIDRSAVARPARVGRWVAIAVHHRVQLLPFLR
jgi:hypothetical protein